ncbi:hypothetical protein [Kitasatospora sp. NPDC057198]|uniref:hypothetical protein n=1 Tax=Kitasatospora sp. NPDC057198 TaxID=3346046 RepID=UPI0036433EBF
MSPRYLPDSMDDITNYPPLPHDRPVTHCEECGERKCSCCARCRECKRHPGNPSYHAARVFPCAVCG